MTQTHSHTWTKTETYVYLVQECDYETVPLTVAYADEELAKEHARHLSEKHIEDRKEDSDHLEWLALEPDEYGSFGKWKWNTMRKVAWNPDPQPVAIDQYMVLRYPVKYELFMEVTGGE